MSLISHFSSREWQTVLFGDASYMLARAEGDAKFANFLAILPFMAHIVNI
jgi:hypothetical protein